MAKIKLTTKEDAQIPQNTEASTINDCLFSAIKTMKLYVNDKPLVSMPFFAYQQYFAKRLAADYSALNTHMTTEGYFVRIICQKYLFLHQLMIHFAL